MAHVGSPERVIDVPEPIEAPSFTPPAKREEPYDPDWDWLNPNKVSTPVTVPERELVPVRR